MVDQCETAAGAIMTEPVYVDVLDLAEEIRETSIDLRARVEQHLDGNE